MSPNTLKKVSQMPRARFVAVVTALSIYSCLGPVSAAASDPVDEEVERSPRAVVESIQKRLESYNAIPGEARPGLANLQKLLGDITTVATDVREDPRGSDVEPLRVFRLLVQYRVLLDGQVDPDFDPEDQLSRIKPILLKNWSDTLCKASQGNDRAANQAATEEIRRFMKEFVRQRDLQDLVWFATRWTENPRYFNLDPVRDRSAIEAVLTEEVGGEQLRDSLRKDIFPKEDEAKGLPEEEKAPPEEGEDPGDR